MTAVLDLPTELLFAVLSVLGAIDLQSLIVAQGTCRSLRDIAQDILRSDTVQRNQWANVPDCPPRIHPLLETNFSCLFNTARCFTPAEKQKLIYLTLAGDYLRPFRRLPWARNDVSRDTYLRPEASWRTLSITAGQLPITHLDVVKNFSAGSDDFVEYYQTELPATGLNMGHLYDVLLSRDATFGRYTGSWELLLGRRLRSFDVLHEYECFITSDEDLVISNSESRQAAILFVRGSAECDDLQAGELGKEDWRPTPLGKCCPRLLPWQGPKLER
ncbi:hypothetical protein F4778DRAFT_667642 [Xylariomycetidae sp. FL2044]|nr:hypothetical protein F4778DRAFT_667642 [Xylariomycetidae sp. FL2044]